MSQAFPSHYHKVHGDVTEPVLSGGMTMREWYATFAMTAMILGGKPLTAPELAELAFRMASIMEQQSKLEQ
jgi:hypothetical protein